MLPIVYGCFTCGPVVRDLSPDDTGRQWHEVACPECGRQMWQPEAV